jgi:hypothetical protein
MDTDEEKKDDNHLKNGNHIKNGNHLKNGNHVNNDQDPMENVVNKGNPEPEDGGDEGE